MYQQYSWNVCECWIPRYFESLRNFHFFLCLWLPKIAPKGARWHAARWLLGGSHSHGARLRSGGLPAIVPGHGTWPMKVDDVFSTWSLVWWVFIWFIWWFRFWRIPFSMAVGWLDDQWWPEGNRDSKVTTCLGKMSGCRFFQVQFRLERWSHGTRTVEFWGCEEAEAWRSGDKRLLVLQMKLKSKHAETWDLRTSSYVRYCLIASSGLRVSVFVFFFVATKVF